MKLRKHTEGLSGGSEHSITRRAVAALGLVAALSVAPEIRRGVESPSRIKYEADPRTWIAAPIAHGIRASSDLGSNPASWVIAPAITGLEKLGVVELEEGRSARQNDI